MTARRQLSEQRRMEIGKVLRAVIRLKYSLQADRELSELIPDAEAAFDNAIQSGQLPDEIDLQALMFGVVNKELPDA